MNRRLLVPIAFAGVALASGVASANPQYWRDNGLLLEVSADPRDGRDFVQVDATRANQLELIALNDTVTLRGITLRFADGRAMTHQLRSIRPGEPVLVDLPRNSGAITGVELEYIDADRRRHDRTAARLQIVPRMTRTNQYYSQYDHAPAYDNHGHAPAYHHGYAVQQPQRPRLRDHRYQVRPARAQVQTGWTIQGSFRF